MIDIAAHGRDPKVEAPDASYIICEERCLMWPLHSWCKVILEQISWFLHRILWSGSIKYVYFVEKHLFHSVVVWNEYMWYKWLCTPGNNTIHIFKTQSWFFYNLHNACLNCRETYFQLAKNQVLLELWDKL